MTAYWDDDSFANRTAVAALSLQHASEAHGLLVLFENGDVGRVTDNVKKGVRTLLEPVSIQVLALCDPDQAMAKTQEYAALRAEIDRKEAMAFFLIVPDRQGNIVTEWLIQYKTRRNYTIQYIYNPTTGDFRRNRTGFMTVWDDLLKE